MHTIAPDRSASPSHVFDEGNPLAERNTRWAVILTACMMVAEIIGGWTFNSMALLADGWHMSSHVLALGLSALAYRVARHLAHDKRFTFGTWKIEILGGYTSAIFLVGVALLMFCQSFERLLRPSPIHYNQAIIIAVLGLLVNLTCAWLLKDEAFHSHDHPRHYDMNLRSAYLHVLTDAATSVLAIFALCGGKIFGAIWLDPAMGIAGAGLVALWAYGLLRDAARVLLDAEMDAPVVEEIRETLSAVPSPAEINDLHVWRVGKRRYACILSVTVEDELSPNDLKKRLSMHEDLVHITIEVNRR